MPESYMGEIIGKSSGGVEVKRLTKEERIYPSYVRYCVDGHSHWNPADFFADEADRLERKAAMMREVAAIIAETEAK